VAKKMFELGDEKLDRIAGVMIYQLRWWGKEMQEIVWSRGLGDDIFQSLYLAAYEAWKEGLDPDRDIRKISNWANRAIYGCLRSFGIRRPRGKPRYEWSEIPIENIKGVR